MLNVIKGCLVRFGSRCGEAAIHYLNAMVNYLEVGHWMAAQGFYTNGCRFGSREELFRFAASEIAYKKVLYLEFGVWRGDSVRYWAELLKHEGSHLDGFDTFEGLPVNWNPYARKGSYSAGGEVPSIADPRVRFYKGLFQETLPRYILPEYEVLVINIDCDVYSSAAFVLNALRARIQPGTYVYFDEFCDRCNELKAFDDFIASAGKRFRLLAATHEFRQVFFQCLP